MSSMKVAALSIVFVLACKHDKGGATGTGSNAAGSGAALGSAAVSTDASAGAAAILDDAAVVAAAQDAQVPPAVAPDAAAPAAARCEQDRDCELVSAQPPSCCSHCSPDAMTKAEAAAANKGCQQIAKANPDYFSRCPHLSCTCAKPSAKCKNHACVVENGRC